MNGGIIDFEQIKIRIPRKCQCHGKGNITANSRTLIGGISTVFTAMY